MLSIENITPMQNEAGQGEKPTDPPSNIRFKERFCSTVALQSHFGENPFEENWLLLFSDMSRIILGAHMSRRAYAFDT